MKMRATAAAVCAMGLAAAGGAINVQRVGSVADFERLPLEPPLNWVAGRFLYPRLLQGCYDAAIEEHDAASWTRYVLDRCDEDLLCTSTLSYSGASSPPPPFSPLTFEKPTGRTERARADVRVRGRQRSKTRACGAGSARSSPPGTRRSTTTCAGRGCGTAPSTP